MLNMIKCIRLCAAVVMTVLRCGGDCDGVLISTHFRLCVRDSGVRGGAQHDVVVDEIATDVVVVEG